MADDDQRIVNIPTEEPTISPDTDPSMFEHVREQSWFAWAVRVVAAVIVIVVIFFGARWLHHRLEHKSNTNPTPATIQRPSESSSNNKSASGANGASNGSGSSNGSNQNTAAGTPSQLADTGPGDIAAIFLASSFAAASLHFIIRLRRDS